MGPIEMGIYRCLSDVIFGPGSSLAFFVSWLLALLYTVTTVDEDNLP